jgi:hypothetical protein
MRRRRRRRACDVTDDADMRCQTARPRSAVMTILGVGIDYQ